MEQEHVPVVPAIAVFGDNDAGTSGLAVGGVLSPVAMMGGKTEKVGNAVAGSYTEAIVDVEVAAVVEALD